MTKARATIIVCWFFLLVSPLPSWQLKSSRQNPEIKNRKKKKTQHNEWLCRQRITIISDILRIKEKKGFSHTKNIHNLKDHHFDDTARFIFKNERPATFSAYLEKRRAKKKNEKAQRQ